MAEKKIQPKAAGAESKKTTVAAAGVEKMSLRRNRRATLKRKGLK